MQLGWKGQILTKRVDTWMIKVGPANLSPFNTRSGAETVDQS